MKKHRYAVQVPIVLAVTLSFQSDQELSEKDVISQAVQLGNTLNIQPQQGHTEVEIDDYSFEALNMIVEGNCLNTWYNEAELIESEEIEIEETEA